ncbi:MAG: hypothetical protein D6730_01405 [Bacteroidetes bacterium]|nr:MAG: hypothetical protein D6730_01405 [Bacteroidota bacterium]
MKDTLRKWLNLLPLLMAVGLLVYTGSRAAVLSMTHDESSTFLNWMEQPVWECFFSEVCWGTANMHLLNTFLMQISVDLFGTHPFAIRLPNVLAHALYLFFSLALLRRISSQWWLVAAGFVLLNVHPYLLDFFSVARGYGLACGFCMMSLYYFYRWLEKPAHSSLLLCLLAASLAVLSNFTFLNYLAVLLGALGVKLLLMDGRSWRLKTQSIGMAAAFALGLGVLLYHPIRFLQGKGEFGYGESSLWLSFQHLVQDNLYGQGYFSAQTLEVFVWITALLLGGSLAWGLFTGLRLVWVHQRAGQALPSPALQFYFLSSLMWGMLVLGLWVQHQWLGTQYLDHRTALLFFPLSAIPVWMMLHHLAQQQSLVALLLASLLGVFGLYHFSRTANWVFVREWYYDAHTKEMIEYIQAQRKADERIRLGTYWTFSHSANFYRITRKLDFLDEIVYERSIRPDSLYDYYYVEPGQGSQLHPAYQLEKKFGLVAELYKRKE